MINRLWIISGLVTAVSLFAGGYWYGRNTASFGTKVVETARSYSRGAEKAEEQHKVVVTERTRTTKKPDGTIVTDVVAVKSVNDYHSSQSEREKAQETTKVTQANKLSDYSLGLTYRIQDKAYGAALGRRLVGPLWGEVQVNQHREVQLGLRIEF